MYKQSVLVLAILVLTGCARKPMPQAPTSGDTEQPSKAEYRIGGDPDQQPRLPFTISAVHVNRSPSKKAPFHAEGGDWTFFDCHAISDAKAVFTVGVASGKTSEKLGISWGKAILAVKDRDAGARFVDLFSKAFSGKTPPTVQRPYEPTALSINTAVLGRDMRRGETGEYLGTGGGWTLIKWFPEHDDRSGEVYFNYNLDQRQGEFSEKDPEYADDLVALFASAFRDGPRPERTPENDPTFTRTGPRIGQPRKLLSRTTSQYYFTPKGRFAVYADDKSVVALALDHPEGKSIEVARLDHSPWRIHAVDEDLTLLFQESIPETPGLYSSDDPVRIWWVDGKSKEKKLIRGPERNLDLAEQPVSPDQRYVVLERWRGDPRKEGRSKVLYILDRNSWRFAACSLSPKDLSVIGWRKTGAKQWASAVTNRWQIDKNEPSESYLINPANGTLDRQANVDARLEIDNPISPDGKHRVRVGKDDLIVTEVATGKKRRFVFHEEDRRFLGPECIEWISPRHLKFNGPRLALIDVMTMKMSFPTSSDGTKLPPHGCRFSPDFRWVLYSAERSDGEGLFLAPVEAPKEP
jgi:hypothetical protein